MGLLGIPDGHIMQTAAILMSLNTSPHSPALRLVSVTPLKTKYSYIGLAFVLSAQTGAVHSPMPLLFFKKIKEFLPIQLYNK